jgi:hypothetical protein
MSSFCEENGLRLAPHPLYSPDLAPSGFFLFGYVKERLKGMVFPSYEELLDEIGEVVTGLHVESDGFGRALQKDGGTACVGSLHQAKEH